MGKAGLTFRVELDDGDGMIGFDDGSVAGIGFSAPVTPFGCPLIVIRACFLGRKILASRRLVDGDRWQRGR
ncbi:hypothetical protein C477_16250 [Haloterrigena salina JCM 13891]|uniref:Uncharacterized protein n=1 Tax=Haloterrigena salina JCM 13891 TaxID=1227488 RepID=M0C159_9EURY|nr:hypothetical protein C477_16250 [Haloterrigena salina JCM 13891]